jgi:hypothetical protein
MTEQTRKGLGALFAVLGAYYCVLGGAVLVQLPSVTSRWIERSGDRDFRLDSDLFLKLSGVGAALILLLGWRTVVKGLATARGRCPSWLWLAMSSLPLHVVWWMLGVAVHLRGCLASANRVMAYVGAFSSDRWRIDEMVFVGHRAPLCCGANRR